MKILTATTLYIIWVIYSSYNKRFRVAEYQDGKFYVERRSDWIPFLWHRNIQHRENSKELVWIYSEVATIEPYATPEEAQQAIDLHYVEVAKRKRQEKINSEYVDLSSKRKRVIKTK